MAAYDNRDSENEFTSICKEYFEISIGCREPSEKEANEAGKLWLQTVFGDGDFEAIDFVKMIKCPMGFKKPAVNWYPVDNPKLRVLMLEVGVFEELAERTDIVDGAFIPMLRHELRVTSNLLQQAEYEFAVLRLHALLETLFRTKADLGEVKWEFSLKSAYRGEDLIDSRTYTKLKEEFNEVRNNLAHDWFSYHRLPEETIEDAAIIGLLAASELLTQELHDVYSSYTSNHPSKRLFSKLEARRTLSPSGSASATVSTLCEKCGHRFVPAEDGWKRCPQCDSPHNFLDRYER